MSLNSSCSAGSEVRSSTAVAAACWCSSSSRGSVPCTVARSTPSDLPSCLRLVFLAAHLLHEDSAELVRGGVDPLHLSKHHAAQAQVALQAHVCVCVCVCVQSVIMGLPSGAVLQVDSNTPLRLQVSGIALHRCYCGLTSGARLLRHPPCSVTAERQMQHAKRASAAAPLTHLRRQAVAPALLLENAFVVGQERVKHHIFWGVQAQCVCQSLLGGHVGSLCRRAALCWQPPQPNRRTLAVHATFEARLASRQRTM